MLHKRTLLSLALASAFVAPAAHAEIAFDVIGGSEISFEGLVQADGNWFENDVLDLNGKTGINGADSEFELRRAELIFKGKGPGAISWVVGHDLKSRKWLDVNAKYTIGANSNNFIQIGQYKQPHSLEELSSTKNNDFIAKASITNAMGISRRLGIAAGTGDTNWTATASIFTRELTRNGAHGPGYGLRGTWAPINGGGNVLHLGLSYIDRDTDGDSIRLRARPLADLATGYLVDTGSVINNDRASTTGLEAMWIGGPFKIQSEYMRTSVKGINAGRDFDTDGAYISAVWNVTGEKHGYKGGVPTTGLPDNPGKGMLQLGLRYDTLNLNDGSIALVNNVPRAVGILGGEQKGWTLGANYYWRSNFKFSLNYNKLTSSKFRNAVGEVDDDPSTVTARAQVYW